MTTLLIQHYWYGHDVFRPYYFFAAKTWRLILSHFTFFFVFFVFFMLNQPDIKQSDNNETPGVEMPRFRFVTNTIELLNKLFETTWKYLTHSVALSLFYLIEVVFLWRDYLGIVERVCNTLCMVMLELMISVLFFILNVIYSGEPELIEYHVIRRKLWNRETITLSDMVNPRVQPIELIGVPPMAIQPTAVPSEDNETVHSLPPPLVPSKSQSTVDELPQTVLGSTDVESIQSHTSKRFKLFFKGTYV